MMDKVYSRELDGVDVDEIKRGDGAATDKIFDFLDERPEGTSERSRKAAQSRKGIKRLLGAWVLMRKTIFGYYLIFVGIKI